MVGYIATVNGKKYEIKASTAYAEKVSRQNDLFGVKLGITVKEIDTDKILNWKEIKGTYLAEKLVDFTQNVFNGQASFYWNWKKENKR